MSNQLTAHLAQKDVVVAYALWWFLGFFGVHRFYLGYTKSATTQLVLFLAGIFTLIFLIGLIPLFIVAVRWFSDAFAMPGLVRKANAKAGVIQLTESLVNNAVQSNLQTIEKLHELKSKGMISQDEFEKMRPQI